MTTTTGDQLRAERAAAYLTVKQIADAMGVHRNTVAAYEKPRPIDTDKASRYRDAIARLTAREAA
jgi:transcriptional regulator with XRE-family HTH domain